MPWPWRARKTPQQTRQPHPLTVSRGEWRSLPPMRPAVPEHPLINPVQRFTGQLAAWRSPAFLAPLGHRLGPAEPSGVADLAHPVTAQGAAADLPLARSPRTRKTAGGGLFSWLSGVAAQRSAVAAALPPAAAPHELHASAGVPRASGSHDDLPGGGESSLINAEFGTSEVPNATLGTSNVPNATLGTSGDGRDEHRVGVPAETAASHPDVPLPLAGRAPSPTRLRPLQRTAALVTASPVDLPVLRLPTVVQRHATSSSASPRSDSPGPAAIEADAPLVGPSPQDAGDPAVEPVPAPQSALAEPGPGSGPGLGPSGESPTLSLPSRPEAPGIRPVQRQTDPVGPAERPLLHAHIPPDTHFSTTPNARPLQTQPGQPTVPRLGLGAPLPPGSPARSVAQRASVETPLVPVPSTIPAHDTGKDLAPRQQREHGVAAPDLPVIKAFGPTTSAPRELPLNSPAAGSPMVSRLIGDRPPLTGRASRDASSGSAVQRAAHEPASQTPAPLITRGTPYPPGTPEPPSMMDIPFAPFAMTATATPTPTLTMAVPTATGAGRFRSMPTVARSLSPSPAGSQRTAAAAAPMRLVHAATSAQSVQPVDVKHNPVVQRQEATQHGAVDAVSPVPEVTAGSPAPPRQATPPAVEVAGGEPDELVKKLFDPLLRRLKTELRLDRERRGQLTDRYH